MLENLGLGIVLTLEDDFTPQANKAIESMTRLSDSAETLEREMQKSMSNLQNIMLAGFSLNQVGREFEQAGKTIFNVFRGITREVVNVNSYFDTMRAQFKTVFGDMAQAQLDWASEFAIKTPFQVKEVSRLMQMMKYQGIDVTKQFKSASGEMKALLEYMGDFSTKNMQQGIEGLAYAISNALGGNFRSIRARFDLTAQQAERLKNALNTSGVDGFIEEFVKLADEITPNAMRNMLGTWEQVIAEMEDTWDVFIWRVGDSGAFDPIKNTLKAISLALAEITSNEQTIKNLASLIRDLWQPVDKLARGLIQVVKSVIDFASAHPQISKLIASFIALSGVASFIVGKIMNLAGNFLILSTSITSAYANLKVLQTLGNVNMFSGFDNILGGIISKLGLFSAILGITTIAFFRNVDNMRDRLNKFNQAWKDSGEIINAGVLRGLENFEKVMERPINDLTKKLIKFRLTAQVIFRTLFGKEVDGVLQYTNEELNNLRATGLLPFAQTMAMIRGRVKSFTDGLVEGFTSSYNTVKKFLDFALIPIRATLESLSERFPAIREIFGIKGEEGIGEDLAEKQIQRFRELGVEIGKLVGGLTGLKIVKSLGKIIVNPFSRMFLSISKVNKEVKKLSTNLSKLNITKKGGFLSNLTTRFTTTKDKISNYFAGFGERKEKAKEHFNNFMNEYDVNLKRSASVYDGYSRINYENIPKNFKKFIVPSSANPYDLYVKNPKGIGGKLSQLFFGEKYYKPSDEGGLTYVGSYGGLFGRERDDTQTRLASQKLGIKMPSVKDLFTTYKGDKATWMYDRENFILQDKKVGSILDLKGNSISPYIEKIKQQRESYIQSRLADKNLAKNAYKAMGVDGRIFNNKPAEKENFLRSYLYTYDPNVKMFSDRITGAYDYANKDLAVYQKRQSKLRDFLFGQKLYTIKQDESGRYYEQIVGRRGGLFRDSSMDMVYNPEEPQPSIRDRLRSTGIGTRLSSARDRISSGISSIGQRLGQNRIISGVRNIGSKITSAPLNFINTQRQRLGMTPILGWRSQRDSAGKITNKGLFRRIGSSLFGRAEYDSTGMMTSKGGLFSRVWGGAKTVGKGAWGVAKGVGKGIGFAGRIAGKGIGLLGRGIGAVGKLATKALPTAFMLGTAGKMAYDSISAKGEGDFSKGLEIVREQIKNLDLSTILDKFKDIFGQVLPIAKEIFMKLAQELPPILAEAWEGLKGLAGLAWEWVKENGLDTLSNLVDLIMPIISGIWEWIKTDGFEMLSDFFSNTLLPLLGKFWDWLTSDGMRMLGEFLGNTVNWLITDGIPTLIKYIGKIGKWIFTEGLPKLLSGLLTFAIEAGEGILDGIVNILGGLGKALGDIMITGLTSAIRLLLPKPLEDAVIDFLGLPKHHRGLWLSDNEHMAVIREDETVLPPDKSRKLDSLLDKLSINAPTPAVALANTSSQPQQVDNSVNIEKVEIVVQAEKLSRQDARKQALMILEEFEKLQKEKNIRTYH